MAKKIYYRGRDENPKDGQMCLCRCPRWCDSGYQVAEYKNGIFDYDDAPNDRLDGDVIAWLPLDENGLPE